MEPKWKHTKMDATVSRDKGRFRIGLAYYSRITDKKRGNLSTARTWSLTAHLVTMVATKVRRLLCRTHAKVRIEIRRQFQVRHAK